VRILEELERVREDFSQLKGQPAGSLRVSAPTVLGLRYLAPALTAFLRRYPDMRLDLVLTASKVDFLAQGIDIAIRFGEQTEPNLVCIQLARSTNVIAGSPAYFARCGTPRIPADLAQHNCLLIHNLTAACTWPLGADASHGVKVRGNLIANNGEVTRQAAIDGLGITTLPSFLIEADLRAKRLVAVLQEHAQENGIYAVMPERRHMPGKVRAFVDFLKSILGPQAAVT
jgi:DNA-binding transcriptional LysR family regulator